ncbi:hypothetical protein ACOMHN_030344 [Nucella lapillus]
MVRQEGDVFSHGIHEHAHASDTGTATKAKLVRDVKEEALVNPFQSAYTIAECLNPQSSGGREKQQRTPPGGCSSSGTSSSPGKRQPDRPCVLPANCCHCSYKLIAGCPWDCDCRPLRVQFGRCQQLYTELHFLTTKLRGMFQEACHNGKICLCW